MLRRPKPTDSESDLLQEQERFLASGSSPAVTVTRTAVKRRGNSASADTHDCDVKTRDVVTIADLPDELPTLTPAPPKKSCSKKERVRFENEDPVELLDKHDTHVSAVLSRIVERDTSAVPVLLPAFTSTAFPKVLHHSTVKNQETAPRVRKSIFARHIAAQKKTGCGEKNDSKVGNSQTSESRPAQGTIDGPLLMSGQGLGPDSALETLKIHQENQARLQGMSRSEILEEQKLLLAQLDPTLVDFVKSRKAGNAASSTSTSIDKSACPDQSLTESKPLDPHYSAPDSQEVPMDTDEEAETESTSHHPITVEQLPIKPEKGWLHMDKLEPEKLEWMSELPPPRKKATKNAMQARFDFSGILIPPTEDLPTHLGLHHHGEEPELAGYSLQELFLLSRSKLTQQRSLALNTLAHILSKARAGEYSSCLKGNVLASLLDAGLLFLLRFSLDDSVEGVISAAVRALRSLLVSNEDEENLDYTFPWLLGMAAFPLVPQLHEEEDEDEDDEGQNESMKDTEKEKEERKLAHDVAQEDVIKGLLKIQLLQRLRYILEVVCPSPETVLDILEILIRIARHSVSAATQILDCPRLMKTVMSDFLPCLWSVLTSPSPPSLYGFPVSKAIKLLRVMGSAGRHVCARILNNLGGKERLSRFLSVEPSELLLESGENIACSTEALRLWAVAASYGQACNLYKDLYPVLVKALQAAHKPWAASENLMDLERHRLKSLLMLLTQVTHTAGCHQELQSGLMSSQAADCLPPPPVTWSNVSGLQPTVMGMLKGCMKKLDDPSQRSSTLSLMPSYMIYMGTYYCQLYLQSSFQPAQCLQELEALTTEVLLPLVSHQVFHRILNSLRSSSVICKAGIGTSAQTLPSLPGLGSSMVNITSLLGPEAPLPLCTALFYLLDNIVTIHRGLTKSFSSLILSDSVLAYLQSCVKATPSVPHASAWILRHEHHFLYLILRLAHRLVPSHPEVKKHASLFHQAALALLSWLLPGSEYLAHELMSTMIFNQDLFPETGSGGPEAATLAELRLQEMSSHSPSSGPLLSDSLARLPLIRACYLTHLAHLEPAVITSRERHLGRNPWLPSQLLPELSGPLLPSDWAFLPLISLYERTGVSQGGGLRAESLPAGSVQSLTCCLQWLLVIESFRERALQLVPPVAKLARLVCIFLCSSDIFLERPVKDLMWALLRGLTRPASLEALDLSLPPPGLASFYDLYSALLTQYEAVSFGDSLFGCFILLPLQRCYSVSMRLAVFGEHVSILRSLGVSLEQLPIALEKFTSPAEDSLPLLLLYFRALVTKALRRNWSPVLYVVAVAHLNGFIFSQDAVPQEVETTRRSLLRKTYYLTDEVLRSHLLLFRLPQQNSELGFSTYEQLTPIRACRLRSIIKTKEGND